MTSYIALLRGINVGGKNKVPMAELRQQLEAAGYENVSTYINSGNVFFEHSKKPKQLAAKITKIIKTAFAVDALTVVLTKKQWQDIVANAPKDWGQKTDWKHNIFVLIDPSEMDLLIEQAGQLKPEIETFTVGDGVVYQSMMLKKFGQTSASKLISQPMYKRITIRNYNTAQKINDLLTNN